jgi:uncharacterized membrane protein YidH (DUF202 family)
MTDISSHIPAPSPTWVERFAKIGLAAKGVIYCLVGALATMGAFEIGGRSAEGAGKNSVFGFILEQPFGQVLLALVAVGLAFYCIWRFIEAINDTEEKGSGIKGIISRFRYLWSGLIYGALAFAAAKLVLGNSSGGDGNTRQTLVSKLLELPLGQWLVGAIALGTIGYGLYQIYYGWSDKYKQKLKTYGLQHDAESLLIRAGKLGYIARGMVWGVIGYIFLKAAIHANPQEAGGSSSAFQFMEQTYGSFLLGAVALGLICYGVFMFMRAKYQPVRPS